MADNILSDLPDASDREFFQTMLQTKAFTLERIISTGQSTPPGEWFEQERDEWVLLLSGKAGLLFEDQPGTIVLVPGDHIRIPAHRRHRVEWTDPAAPTVWLALHFEA